MPTPSQRIEATNGENYDKDTNPYGYGNGGHSQKPSGNSYVNYIQLAKDLVAVFAARYDNSGTSAGVNLGTVETEGGDTISFILDNDKDYIPGTYFHAFEFTNHENWVYCRIPEDGYDNTDPTEPVLQGVVVAKSDTSDTVDEWEIRGPGGGPPGPQGNDSALANAVSDPQNNDFLVHNGTTWVNLAMALLTAIHALSATGLIARTGSGTAAARTITGTSGEIVVTNGGGVSGNPTLSAGTDMVKKNTANAYTASNTLTPQALTSSSGSIAWDAANGNNAHHTATENTTLANPTNLADGMVLCFRWKQHASSAKTLAFGSKWKFQGSSTVSATTGSVQIFTGRYNATDDIIETIMTGPFS